MKKKLTFLFSMIGLIVILSLAIKNYVIKMSKSELENNYYEVLKNATVLESKNEDFSMWDEVQYKIWHSRFDNFCEVLNLPINDPNILSCRPKIVYWFNKERACSVCIQEDMDFLVEIIDSVGSDNFLIISNFSDDKEIELFEYKYGLKDICYNIKEGG